MQSLTLIQKIEKFENIGAEMVRDGLNKTKLFSDISVFNENNQSRSFKYNQTASR